MARRLTARRKITKDRALSIIDSNIDILKRIADEARSEGYESDYATTGISVLETLRYDLKQRCDYGVFPSDD